MHEDEAKTLLEASRSEAQLPSVPHASDLDSAWEQLAVFPQVPKLQFQETPFPTHSEPLPGGAGAGTTRAEGPTAPALAVGRHSLPRLELDLHPAGLPLVEGLVGREGIDHRLNLGEHLQGIGLSLQDRVD